MSRFVVCLLGFVLSLSALAQTSSFDAVATGIAEPVPMLVAEDLTEPDGRFELHFTPDAITSGGQRILDAGAWAVWIWRDQVHAQFDDANGRRLFRAQIPTQPDLPLEGTAAAAGSETEVVVSWSAAGVGIFINGTLRGYLEGAPLTPSNAIYGARPDGRGPYNGTLSLDVYAEPAVYDPCENFGAWGTVETDPIPEPTCQPVDDEPPAAIVDGQAQFTIGWTPPAENEDGSAIEALAGYVVYWDQASRSGRCSTDRPGAKLDDSCYANALDLTDGELVSAPLTLSLTEDTTLYFAMVAYASGTDGETLLSRYSNEIARSFVLEIDEVVEPAPGAPTLDQVEVQLTCTIEDPGLICRFRSLE